MEECCSLCEKRAAILCDSDQAKLCWGCDARVHSANFLVAKHSRVLLCSLCNSLTPWNASGPKLTPTLSFCHSCSAHRRAARLRRDDDYVNNDDDDDREYSSHSHHDDDDDDGDDDGEESEEEEGGENQVVPMS
ncbi:B-box zinc finger protein 32-like [Lotus japonicus]|uniref:B-box zinc finger protein 32-like n=1 Tax=Lotus japonicus TaxID=34305 RepID=UPI00258C1D5B|nr:B-box zinc finger protein 32-like [Lotus japonicus]